jgi:hypothetical protein
MFMLLLISSVPVQTCVYANKDTEDERAHRVCCMFNFKISGDRKEVLPRLHASIQAVESTCIPSFRAVTAAFSSGGKSV